MEPGEVDWGPLFSRGGPPKPQKPQLRRLNCKDSQYAQHQQPAQQFACGGGRWLSSRGRHAHAHTHSCMHSARGWLNSAHKLPIAEPSSPPPSRLKLSGLWRRALGLAVFFPQGGDKGCIGSWICCARERLIWDATVCVRRKKGPFIEICEQNTVHSI